MLFITSMQRDFSKGLGHKHCSSPYRTRINRKGRQTPVNSTRVPSLPSRGGR